MSTASTVGRENELAAVDTFLDEAAGGARALLLAGEAGIGKTTLWEHGVEAARARFPRVLTCRGIETESSLSFAALSDLLGPVFDEIAPGLTLPRRRALEVVLLLSEPGDATPDPLAIGLAVLDALRALSDKGPCVLALDDIQWLDAASAAALQIALRRLDAEPVAVLATFRQAAGLSIPIDLEHSFPAGRVTSVVVGPLDIAALHRLLHDRVGLDLTRPEITRLQSITHGNPFFALEVGRELQRTGSRPTEEGVVRVPETLSAALADRLARLPEATADVLLTTAATARPTVDLIAAAHGDRASVVKSLAAAAEEGLIVLEDQRVRFSHPLHASVCYQRAPIAKRRAAHRMLAVVVGDPEERALHLARGAEGPDATVATQLDEAASGAAARGAPAVGANLLELAADLTPADPMLARRRRLRAAALHRISGNNPRAIRLLEELLPNAEPGAERADILTELAATSDFGTPDVVALCDEALAEAAGDDTRSVRILVSRSLARMVIGEIPAALADGEAALALAEKLEDQELIAIAIARIAHAEARSVETRRPLLDRAVDIERSQHLALEFLDSPRRALGRQQMRMGEIEDARTLFEELAEEAAARGDERTRTALLWVLVLVEWLAGRWQRALALATEAVGAGEQTQAVSLRQLIVRKALVEADLGMVTDARSTAARGFAGPPAGATRFFELEVVALLGRIELMLGNANAAAALLGDLPERWLALGSDDPAAWRWPDVIEALVDAGEVARAREVFAQWEQRAERQQGPLALATVARCKGLLLAVDHDLAAAERAMTKSLTDLGDKGYPLERARTLLCWGTVLRHANRRAAARITLEQSLAILEELGARLWAEKARAELTRISGRRPASQALTNTEREVAALAALGQSNKEIAASLHMGVSTVEAHLSSVYRKLDVKRAELGVALAEL